MIARTKKARRETATKCKSCDSAARSHRNESPRFSRRSTKPIPKQSARSTHRTPWELLVATILSAQCTDVRVNMVTPELFRRFPSPAAMAKARLPELEELIRTTGFFRNKAKSIQGAARKIIADFGGEVPQTLAELITVPGAARKTANVVLGVSFRQS